MHAAQGVAILGMLVALALRGEPVAAAPLVGLTVVVEAVLMTRLLRQLATDVTLASVLAPLPDPPANPDPT